MPRKRARIPVVFDTNLFVTRFIKHDRHGINRRVMDLWQAERKLQLIISPPVKREYLRVFGSLCRDRTRCVETARGSS